MKEYVGHGIGTEMHQEPEVPNFGKAGHGLRLRPGMTLAIEPMINMGTWEVVVDEIDEWTVRTADGKPSAQWEIQVLVTEDGHEVLAY